MNTPKEIKRIKRMWNTYKRCSQGKLVNCDKCIGCSAKK